VGSTLGEEGSEGRVVVDEVGSCSQELGEGGRRQAQARTGAGPIERVWQGDALRR
jgi:hypothetical protein